MNTRIALMVLRRQLLLVLAIAGTASVSHAVVIGVDKVAMIWLPSGINVAALILWGRRYWPAVALADVLMQLLPPPTPAIFFPFSAGANVLAAVAAVSVFRQLTVTVERMYSVRSAAAIVVAAFVYGLVSAPIGVIGLLTLGVPPETWLAATGKWLSSNIFGVLMLAPAIILALDAYRLWRSTSRPAHWVAGREFALWLGLLIACFGLPLLTVDSSYRLGLSSLPLALLIWAALRFNPLLSALGSLLVGVGITLICGLGLAGFPPPSDAGNSAVLMLFLATLALLPLFLSAASHQRRLAAAELQRANAELERRVAERTSELSLANRALTGAMHDLRAAQEHMVEREKMASLGGLVAGVAHEVNTPVGVALTTASSLHEGCRELRLAISAGNISKSRLTQFLDDLDEGQGMVVNNLKRTAELVNAFKQLAVDQNSERSRAIVLGDYLDEALLTLFPLYRNRCTIERDCPPGLHIQTYPGALSQVLAQLISNAADHAYADGQVGPVHIRARVAERDDVAGLQLEIADHGAGMSAEVLDKACEPFFTTSRGKGSSGLGLHLVYNLVVQVLGGAVELHSSPGEGCRVDLWLPDLGPAPDRAVAVAGLAKAAKAVSH